MSTRADRMRLPDFVGVGALKAGTTYLDTLLRSHPELCLPRVKEVDFFSAHYERGPAWYARRFSGCGDRRAGEVSPQYLMDARCPGRIHDLLPKVRILASVRDPVQRAYSQYKHWVQVSAYKHDFERFLEEHPNAIEGGRYHHLLGPYLELFPREQLHVVIFEDLVSAPIDTTSLIFSFLGVDRRHRPTALEATNVSRRTRFPRAYVQMRRASAWLRERGAGRLVDVAKRAGARRPFDSPDAGGFDPMPPNTAARLADTYREDVERLSQLLGRDLFVTWKSLGMA